MSEIVLPSLGAEMDEGTLLEWYVKPGDLIRYGDVIALLDTEKAEVEMEAFESGTLDALLIEPGQTVAVGDPIAILSDSDQRAETQPSRAPLDEPKTSVEAAPPTPTAQEEASAPPPEAPPTEKGTKNAVSPSASEHRRIRATPLARRSAKERGIDLNTLSGSGPSGAIVDADVPAARPLPTSPIAPSPRPSPASLLRQAEPTSRASRRREIIAAAMARSKREIPHYYLSTTIGVKSANDWLDAQNLHRAASERIVLSALLMKSVAQAAKQFPEMNGHWIENEFRSSPDVHLGMVIALRTGGLVVPTFRNADQRSVSDLMSELRDVVGRARAGRLRTSELGDATLTLTSLGDDGAETIFGVIYPPQVAIVGFGGIHPALWVEGDLHGTRPVIRASLAADHRASDGQRGSLFLTQIAKKLSDPEQL